MSHPTSIFIVEDEALIAMELRDHLQRLGYHICGQAARGEAALSAIPQRRPDLAIMDINLAGPLNGIETAERLASLVDMPIVFLSAYSDPSLVAHAVRTGPFGFLVKPYDPRELHATIEVALNRHRIERALRPPAA